MLLHARSRVDMDAEAEWIVEGRRRRAGRHDVGGALGDAFRQAVNRAVVFAGGHREVRSDGNVEGGAGGEGALGLDGV